MLATSCLASIPSVEKISYLHAETCCSNFIQRGKDPGCQNYILFGDYCPAPNSFLSEAAYIEDFRTFFSLTMKGFSVYLLCKSLLIVMKSENNFVQSGLF